MSDKPLTAAELRAIGERVQQGKASHIDAVRLYAALEGMIAQQIFQDDPAETRSTWWLEEYRKPFSTKDAAIDALLSGGSK